MQVVASPSLVSPHSAHAAPSIFKKSSSSSSYSSTAPSFVSVPSSPSSSCYHADLNEFVYPEAPRCSLHASPPSHAHAHATHAHHHQHVNNNNNCCNLPRQSFWNTKCNCIFSALPDELLLFKVFLFFHPIELLRLNSVCKRWRFLTADPILYRDVDFSQYASHLTDVCLSLVLQPHSLEIQRLKLCNCRFITSSALQHMNSLFNQTSQLRELHLCSLKSLSDSLLLPLLPHMPQLQYLSLFGCVDLSDVSLQAVQYYCADLEELSVRGCTKLTDQAFIGIFTHNHAHENHIAGSFARLKGLNVANCKQLSVATMSYISKHCKALSRLNLHALTITDTLIAPLAQLPLHTLHLSSANPFGGNPQLTDQGLSAFVQQCRSLQCLNLQGCINVSNAFVAQLVQCCRTLERLNVGGCHKLTNDAIDLLIGKRTTSSSITASTHSANKLKLTHLSVFQCYQLTNDAIIALMHNMPTLQHLDLHSVVALTDDILQQLLVELPSNSLASSDVLSLDADTNSSLNHTSTPPSSVSTWPQSASASASASASLSSSQRASLTGSLYALPLLTELDVGSCRNLTKQTIEQLKQTRTNIQITFY